MGVLLICTDLAASDPRHAKLDAALREDHGTCRVMGSTWAGFTSGTASKWYTRVRGVLGRDYPVLVVGTTSDHAGQLPEETMSWVDRHLGHRHK